MHYVFYRQIDEDKNKKDHSVMNYVLCLIYIKKIWLRLPLYWNCVKRIASECNRLILTHKSIICKILIWFTEWKVIQSSNYRIMQDQILDSTVKVIFNNYKT